MSKLTCNCRGFININTVVHHTYLPLISVPCVPYVGIQCTGIPVREYIIIIYRDMHVALLHCALAIDCYWPGLIYVRHDPAPEDTPGNYLNYLSVLRLMECLCFLYFFFVFFLYIMRGIQVGMCIEYTQLPSRFRCNAPKCDC